MDGDVAPKAVPELAFVVDATLWFSLDNVTQAFEVDSSGLDGEELPDECAGRGTELLRVCPKREKHPEC
ncbi:hypothetical protein GCM10010981_40390 [Dyella nitratireducens]|uniref:Uncharacterized protein n=1 Tax=Dyella nitratireducens TaxID=1849580 RepID=A0ABQ1GN84_9GAMM|nr:hypothetical protein GCM10010981_40390 [Dyella nitratireducens]GLQ41541.1 hypothetical protein GCM10007902_13910 [Dyella nitratireducens]